MFQIVERPASCGTGKKDIIAVLEKQEIVEFPYNEIIVTSVILQPNNCICLFGRHRKERTERRHCIGNNTIRKGEVVKQAIAYLAHIKKERSNPAQPNRTVLAPATRLPKTFNLAFMA